MADIQSATAEIRRGKKRRTNYTTKIQCAHLLRTAAIKTAQECTFDHACMAFLNIAKVAPYKFHFEIELAKIASVHFSLGVHKNLKSEEVLSL